MDRGSVEMKQQAPPVAPKKPTGNKWTASDETKPPTGDATGKVNEPIRKPSYRTSAKPSLNLSTGPSLSRSSTSSISTCDDETDPQSKSTVDMADGLKTTTLGALHKRMEGKPSISSSTSLSLSSSSSISHRDEESSIDDSSQDTAPGARANHVSKFKDNQPHGTKSIVVPLTPPTPRNVRSHTSDEKPLAPSRLSMIRQNHLASKRREQMRAKNTKLPELAESSELDSDPINSTSSSFNLSLDTNSSLAATLPGHSHLDKDDQLDVSMDTSSPALSPTSLLSPPSWTDDRTVTPSLSDSMLHSLGLNLRPPDLESVNDNVSIDQLSEKEIESKFISLSLAFKTDKLTLDQRVSIQERSRDLAEQNVDKEIQGLKDVVETLNQIVPDDDGREVIQKLNRHIEVLEQSAARVSSRAEVYGAVQQEHRMSKAMEVMVLYTENLRRVREKEESELQEARKVLSERSANSFFGGDFAEGGHTRRSMSVCGANPLGRPMRRRSEVVLPKVLGGVGGPSMIPTASMESVVSPPFIPEHLGPSASLISLMDPFDNEDARARFQSAIASTSMQNAVTSTIRRVTQEKSRSHPPSISLSAPPSASIMSNSYPPLLSETVIEEPEISPKASDSESVLESPKESKNDVTPTLSKDENAYRKGFEEGFKAKLSQELTDLRDQQNSISQNIEDAMDKVDQAQLNDEEQLSQPSRVQVAVNMLVQLGVFLINYNYMENKKLIRNIAGVFFIFVAILAVFLSPPITTVNVQYFAKPPH